MEFDLKTIFEFPISMTGDKFLLVDDNNTFRSADGRFDIEPFSLVLDASNKLFGNTLILSKSTEYVSPYEYVA